jgi:hypothetical protein
MNARPSHTSWAIRARNDFSFGCGCSAPNWLGGTGVYYGGSRSATTINSNCLTGYGGGFAGDSARHPPPARGLTLALRGRARWPAGVRLNKTVKGGINNFNINIWTMRGAISVTQAPSRGPSGTPTRAPSQVPTARPTQALPCSSFDGQLFAVRALRRRAPPPSRLC